MRVVVYVDEALEADARALLAAVLQQPDAALLASALFEETCLHGHHRTPENDLRWKERAWVRTCRACHQEGNRRRRATRAARPARRPSR